MRAKPFIVSLLALLLLLRPGLEEEAAAGPCRIRQQPTQVLADLGGGVQIRVDHTYDAPVVMWLTQEGAVRWRRYAGPGWTPEVAVETGLRVPLTDGGVHRAASLAIGPDRELHLIISDGVGVYHSRFDQGWSEPERIADIQQGDLAHLFVFAQFDLRGRLHVVYSWEVGGARVFYLVNNGDGWSAAMDIGEGDARFPNVAMGPNDGVHVVWVHRLASQGGLRNWQGFYRKRRPGGHWDAVEQATREPPVCENIGPVAISPDVAVDASGGVHMTYPVDSPGEQGIDSGHLSYIQRTDNGWSEPLELFQNARHAAKVAVEVDQAGVKYAFGLSWRKRYAVDTGNGFGDVRRWHDGNARWFDLGTCVTAGGAWIAYAAGRGWGPVETVHLRRTGDCPGVSLEDSDGDGVPDEQDLCPDWPDPGQIDTDRDGVGDLCDEDDDDDRVPDVRDNCWRTPNPDQLDSDGDGLGDACSLAPFCPDALCRDGEDACSCPADCIHQCCIEGRVVSEGTVSPDNPCLLCAARVFQHEWSPAPDGTRCDDLDPCTLDDLCQDGTCRGRPGGCVEPDPDAGPEDAGGTDRDLGPGDGGTQVEPSPDTGYSDARTWDAASIDASDDAAMMPPQVDGGPVQSTPVSMQGGCACNLSLPRRHRNRVPRLLVLLALAAGWLLRSRFEQP